MRQQRNLGREAEAAYLFRRHSGDADDLFRRGILVDVGIGDEQDSVGKQHPIHGGENARFRALADDVEHVSQVGVVAADCANE